MGVKINYEIMGVKGIEECFTLEDMELILIEIKACEKLTGEKAKIEFELCE